MKNYFKFNALRGQLSALAALEQGANLNISPCSKTLDISARQLDLVRLFRLARVTASGRKADLIIGMIRGFGTNHCGGTYDKSNPVLQERWSRSDGVR